MKHLIPTLTIALISFWSFGQDSWKEHYNQQLDELNADISKDAGNLALYYSRADVYDVLNDFDHANKDYLKVLDLYQKNPDSKFIGEYAKSCYRLADDYFFRSSNREKALKYVRQGLEVSQGFKDLEVLEAILLGLDPEQYEVANEKYQSLTAKYPADVRLNMYYAKFLEKNTPLEATIYYEKVIAADPQNREALLSLATIYNNMAHDLSEQVISDPAMIFDYAQKAANYFEKLYKQYPTDKELANVLVSLYDELDEQEKAELIKTKTPY